MAKLLDSQKKAQRKYKARFTRPEVLIDSEVYNIYKEYIQNKGYTSINDYINIILKVDIDKNIIPKREDMLAYTNFS